MKMMVRGIFHVWCCLGLCAIAATSAVAENFAAPAEGPVAFRRDRLPIDVETMAVLSRQLLILARAHETGTAAQRRTVAQMLALATALDPGDARARDLIARLVREKGRAATENDVDQAEKARTRAWEILAWLESPEAGASGRALAACLLDVLAAADPEHPQAQAARAAGERGAWAGWIPKISAYEAPVIAKKVIPENPPAEPDRPEPGFLLAAAQVSTPLWKQTQPPPLAAWELVPAPLEMTATTVTSEDGKAPPFSLIFGKPGELSPLTILVPGLLRLLEKQHGTLPPGVVITIQSDALTASSASRKLQSVSAAAAVLASAAISGREPQATIIGQLDESGAFKLPTGFWGQLQSLGPGNGGRLVLPAAAADFLPSLLAMEKPQVFFDYEVVLAADFQELLALSAKAADGVMAKVSAQFREIREKAGTQPLGQYIANPFIRRRLADIIQEAPFHHSAKMLVIQGAGDRPVSLPRGVLATELRRAIVPVEWLMQRPGSSFKVTELEQLGTTYTTVDARIEHLLRYAEKKADRELVGRVKDMATTIRMLDRVARGRGEPSLVALAVQSAHLTVVRAYGTVTEELAREAGEPEPSPAP